MPSPGSILRESHAETEPIQSRRRTTSSVTDSQGHHHRYTPILTTQIKTSLIPKKRPRDGTFWRRSNVISSRRRDQIPDPEAEATAVSASASAAIKSPCGRGTRPQRNDVFAPDPPPPTKTTPRPKNEGVAASPELRPGRIGRGGGDTVVLLSRRRDGRRGEGK